MPGGTTRAAIDLTAALAARSDVEVVGVAARHKEPAPAAWLPSVPVHQLPLPRRLLYETWHAWRWPSVEFATGRVDVVHQLGGAVPGADAPLVATIHDLAFLHHPRLFSRHGLRFFRRALDLQRRYARVVFCSSQATLDDCLAAGFDAHRLRLVPLAAQVTAPTDDDVAAVRRSFGLDGPYVVVVGTLEPRKNLAALLRAWRLLDRTDVTLAVVGPEGWGEALGPDGVPAGVELLGFVDQRIRDALYAGAELSVYPSVFEGFGLPVLEAMSLGCPVVTSAGTACEELVTGGAGVAVDPLSDEAIAGAVAGLLDDTDARRRLAEAGLARSREYSWERTAALVREGYDEVAAG